MSSKKPDRVIITWSLAGLEAVTRGTPIIGNSTHYWVLGDIMLDGQCWTVKNGEVAIPIDSIIEKKDIYESK